MEVHHLEDPVLQIEHPQLLPYALTVAIHVLPQRLVSVHLEGPHYTWALQEKLMGLQHLLEPPSVILLHAGEVQMRSDELMLCIFQLLRGHFYNIASSRLGRKGRTHARWCRIVDRPNFIWLGPRRLVECLLHALYSVFLILCSVLQECLPLFSQQPPDMVDDAQLISHRLEEAKVVYKQAI